MSDFIRFQSLYEYGGVYFDKDFVISKWDLNLNKFDLVCPAHNSEKMFMLESHFFAVEKNSPVTINALASAIKVFQREFGFGGESLQEI